MATLLQKKNELLDQIAQLGTLRRGQLSEQYYEKTNAKGEAVRTGPYYVWQAWVKGKKRSIRISKDEVKKMLKEIETNKQYKQLCEELADVMEQMSLEPLMSEEETLKKNSMKRGSL